MYVRRNTTLRGFWDEEQCFGCGDTGAASRPGWAEEQGRKDGPSTQCPVSVTLCDKEGLRGCLVQTGVLCLRDDEPQRQTGPELFLASRLSSLSHAPHILRISLDSCS